MFLGQLALLVLVWAGAIVLLVRRRERLILATRAQSRSRRALEAVGMLVASIAVLALTMVVLARGGLEKEGFTLGGWAATAFGGVAFIVLQTLGLVPLVLNAVTPEGEGSSDRKDSNRS